VIIVAGKGVQYFEPILDCVPGQHDLQRVIHVDGCIEEGTIFGRIVIMRIDLLFVSATKIAPAGSKQIPEGELNRAE